MTIEMLKGKIHRATVVQAELDYVGSITVDEELLEAAGITVSYTPLQSSKSLIELLNLMTIPFRISSVSPQGIKIYQIYKTQPMKIFCTDFCCLLHPLDRTVRMIGFCDSLTTENIMDLSNTDHI